MTTVAVDVSSLSDASEHRGIGTYLTHVLTGLAARPDLRVVALARPAVELPPGVARVAVRRMAPTRLALSDTSARVTARAGRLAVRWLSTRAAPVEHDLLLSRDLRRVDADVVFVPSLPPPRRSPAPWVTTLHDVIPLARPDPLYARETRRWRRLAPRFRDAAAVIAVSRFSADQGIEHLGLDPSLVHVVHHGVGAAYTPDGPAVAADPPYLLYVGAWGAHKGFAEAVAVVGRLAGKGYPHRLRIAGPQDVRQLERIAEVVRASPRPDRVDVVGFVDDLAALYRGAAAVVVTSRFEGFGLPAAEAMACGAPVVAFANSSLPEVIGDGGLLVADGDVSGFVTAVAGLLDDERAASDLSAAAVRRARAFRWDRSVEAHAEILLAAARPAGQSRSVR